MTTKTSLPSTPHKQTFQPTTFEDDGLVPELTYDWLTPGEQIIFDAKPMDDWIWITKNNEAWLLKNMARTHIQNCLNWCIKKPSGHRKDGRLYQDWITAFTVKLFDPKVE
jgi:hypothetical protein